MSCPTLPAVLHIAEFVSWGGPCEADWTPFSLCSFLRLTRVTHSLRFAGSSRMGVKRFSSYPKGSFSKDARSWTPRKALNVTKAILLIVFVLLAVQQLFFYKFDSIQPQPLIPNRNRIDRESETPQSSDSLHQSLSNEEHVEMPRKEINPVTDQVQDAKSENVAKNPNTVYEKKSRKLLVTDIDLNRNLRLSQTLIKFDGEYKKLESSKIGHMIKKLSNYLSLARNYLTLAQEFEDTDFVRELEQEIEKCLVILDTDDFENSNVEIESLSIKYIDERTSSMERLLHEASLRPYDTSTLISQLKKKLSDIEKETRKIDYQSKLYSQIASKSIPMNLHCLSMSLTLRIPMKDLAHSQNYAYQQTSAMSLYNGYSTEEDSSALTDNSLWHYALFSDNIIAVAVVVNSTSQNLKHPGKHVFHIVTDRMNYHGMKTWFMLFPPPGIIVEVTCLNDYSWINSSYVPVLKQIENENLRRYYFRSSIADIELDESEDNNNFKYRNPKYLSILNHLRFYLPEIFPKLDKILFLDDDVVVQKDLSPLWDIDMHGNVNLAVETCGVTFHRFKTYLNFSNDLISGFDPEGCGWAFGMNMFDLNAWRAGNYTQVYHYWQKQNENRMLWKLGTLPAGLLTFYNKTQPLDRSWQVLGLGSFNTIPEEKIENAAVIHYNGHAKPWLELALLRYQKYWTKYVPYSEELLQACNILPP